MATGYKPLGVTGLNRQGGKIYEEFLTELRGIKWHRAVREMSEQDEMIGAVLFAIEMMLRQVDWTVEPFSEDVQDVERAEFVDECLYDMADTWDDTLSEILTMLPWGFAPLEVVMKRRPDRRIGWHSWSIRSQDTVDEWVWNNMGGVAGFWQVAPPDYKRVFIPIEKLLLFRTTSRKGSPEGRSILRNAYRSWYFKKNIQNVEGIGIERDLAGLLKLTAPGRVLASDATDDEVAIYNRLVEIGTAVKNDEQAFLLLPSDRDENGNLFFDATLMSTGGTRQFDTNQIIQRYDQRIAMTVLADFILLGHEKVGSFSLSSDKTNLFSTALSAWLDSIGEVINRFAIPKLIQLNGWPIDRLPRVVHGDIERVSMAELADYVSKLTGTVIQPDDDLERYMRQQADLPAPGTPRKPPAPAVPPGQDDNPDDNQDGNDDDVNDNADDAQMAAMVQAAARILARGW